MVCSCGFVMATGIRPQHSLLLCAVLGSIPRPIAFLALKIGGSPHFYLLSCCIPGVECRGSKQYHARDVV